MMYLIGVFNQPTFETYLEAFWKLDMSPGMAISLVQHGGVVFHTGKGVRRPEGLRISTETPFYIASTTKSFTGYLASELDRRQMIDLEASVLTYLPELKLDPRIRIEEIRVKDLLTCTHGISGKGPVTFRTAYSGVYTRSQLISLLSVHEPAENGMAFKYSNLGFVIYSLILDRVMSNSWKEVMHDEIFLPLGMRSTFSDLNQIDHQELAFPFAPVNGGFKEIPYGKSGRNMHAAGGHISTVEDLSKWVLENLKAHNQNDLKLNSKSLLLNQKHHVDQNRDWLKSIHRFGWGFGWDLGRLHDKLLVHRFGTFSGFFSHVSFMPDQQVGVVILTNGGWTSYFLADALAETAYDFLNQHPDRNQRADARLQNLKTLNDKFRKDMKTSSEQRKLDWKVSDEKWRKLLGQYKNEHYGLLSIQMDGGQLWAKMGLAKSVIDPYDLAKDQFRVTLTGNGKVLSFFHGQKNGFEFNGVFYEKLP